jgi:hypothetical protein
MMVGRVGKIVMVVWRVKRVLGVKRVKRMVVKRKVGEGEDNRFDDDANSNMARLQVHM